jgi:glycosyltransferase involved in cell wall biosynthesis
VNVATWLAARKAGVPIAHFLHSYFLNCWRGSLYHNDKSCETRCTSCRVLSVGKRASAVQVNAVVGEARYIIDRHVRDGLFGDAKHYVIPSPMTDDPAPVPPAPKTLAPGQPVRIGYIGNLSVEKGVFTLAAAARRLREAYGDRVRFVIAGTGRDDVTEDLKKAMPADATTFLGWCKPVDFYSQVDVVVVPSQWNEPFGRVSIEPLEYALPVIVARSGGLPENVDDGVSGRVFTPADVDELTGLLSGLIDDPAEYARLSRGAAERAPLYFFPAFIATLDKMVREMGGVPAKQTAEPAAVPEKV